MAKIIGVTGYAGSGKDTCAGVLIAQHGYRRLAYADKLKEICASLYGCDVAAFHDVVRKESEVITLSNVQDIQGKLTDFIKSNLPVSYFYDATTRLALFIAHHPELQQTTPRRAAQIIGTEGFRQHIHPDFWVEVVARRHAVDGIDTVVTDVRFPNEVKPLDFLIGIDGGTKAHDHASEAHIAALIDKADFKFMNTRMPTVEAAMKNIEAGMADALELVEAATGYPFLKLKFYELLSASKRGAPSEKATSFRLAKIAEWLDAARKENVDRMIVESTSTETPGMIRLREICEAEIGNNVRAVSEPGWGRRDHTLIAIIDENTLLVESLDGEEIQVDISDVELDAEYENTVADLVKGNAPIPT